MAQHPSPAMTDIAEHRAYPSVVYMDICAKILIDCCLFTSNVAGPNDGKPTDIPLLMLNISRSDQRDLANMASAKHAQQNSYTPVQMTRLICRSMRAR